MSGEVTRDVQHPTILHYLAWVVLVAALVSLALIRIDLTDTPWHLATARQAFEQGAWPKVNTFSYTHPDYPVYQQYPIYQSVLYAVFQRAGWEGLSVLHGVSWAAIVALTIVWGGGVRKAATHPFLWTVVLLGFQRRMTLRPDIGTLICVLGLLIATDRYPRRPWLSSVSMVFIQWCFANTHQLYPIGIAILGSFWLELMCRRSEHWGERRAGPRLFACGPRLPIWPMSVGLVAGLAACLGTPLGWEIVKGPAQTLGSLSSHRTHVVEFARLWTSDYDVVLSLVAAILGGVSFAKRRLHLPLFEMLFFAIAGVLAVNAIRGVPFLVLAGLGSYARSLPEGWSPRSSTVKADRELSLGQLLGVLATCVIGTFIIHERWWVGARVLGGSPFGVGRTLGVWPDKALNFVRSVKPNGPMLNLTWYSGNALIWELYPNVRVFVDPRFEAYPRRFLLDAIEATDRPEALDHLIAIHGPGWVFLETRFASTQGIAKRLSDSGRWSLVYADSTGLVLVSTDQNEELSRRFTVDLERVVPADLDAQADIAALQWIRWAGLMRRFESSAAEERSLEHARTIGGRFPTVQWALGAYPASIP